MKYLIILLLTTLAFRVSAQDELPIKINDFSDKYEATIHLNKDNKIVEGRYEDYVPKYILQIVDTYQSKIVVEAYLNELPSHLPGQMDSENGIPYDSQSVFLYKDYNFDNIKDLALMNGYNSCYGGPSFDIYLAENDNFIYSSSFSYLSNEYCGMFQVNTENNTLHATLKSGCCWHQFTDFKVINNEPKPVKITEYSSFNPHNFTKVTEIFYAGETEKIVEKLYFPMEEMMSKIILYFELDNDKSAILYELDNRLHYVFLKEVDEVEFYFPQNGSIDAEQNNLYPFTYSQQNNQLEFSNKNAKYQIYETENEIGIHVFTNGKKYNRQGNNNTVIGALKYIKNWKLINTKHENN